MIGITRRTPGGAGQRRLCSDPPQGFNVALRNPKIVSLVHFRQHLGHIAMIGGVANCQWMQSAVVGVSDLRRRTIRTKIVGYICSHRLKPLLSFRRNRRSVFLEEQKPRKEDLGDQPMIEGGMLVIHTVRIGLVENFGTELVPGKLRILRRMQLRKQQPDI